MGSETGIAGLFLIICGAKPLQGCAIPLTDFS
jgi:hypothetical protein